MPTPKFDASHKYVTSPLIQPPVLAFLRLSIAAYTLTGLILTLVHRATVTRDAGSYFSYFTNLSYTGLCAYYTAAAVQTASYAIRWRRAGAGVGYPLQRWPRAAQVLHVVLQASVITFPLLVTAIYWSLLATPSTFSTPYSSWSNISFHIFNTLFSVLEVLGTNSPPAPWHALPCTLVVLAGYLCIAYITRAAQGFYPYSFLDPAKEHAKVAAYVFGIGVGQCVVFALVRGVVVLRERCAVRAGRVLVVAADGGRGVKEGEDEGWEEIQRDEVGV